MPDDRFVVNFAALSTASGDINSAAIRMDSALAECEAQAKPLIETWEGDAQAAFHARQARWTEAANDLKQMLSDIRSAMDHSAERFQATEHRNQDLFQY